MSLKATPTPARYSHPLSSSKRCRVDHRGRRGQHLARLVVVGDHHVEPERGGVLHLTDRRDAVVHRDDEAHPVVVDELQRLPVEAVALPVALGDVIADVRARGLEIAVEHDRRHDAVAVVVAVDGDPLPLGKRPPDARHGLIHVADRQRVGQRPVRRQEPFDLFPGVIPSAGQHPHGNQRQAQLAREPLGRRLVGAPDVPAFIGT